MIKKHRVQQGLKKHYNTFNQNVSNNLKKMKKTIIVILIVLNLMVLLGQVWPEGAPPFARIVNIIFLIGTLLFLIYTLLNKRKH